MYKNENFGVGSRKKTLPFMLPLRELERALAADLLGWLKPGFTGGLE